MVGGGVQRVRQVGLELPERLRVHSLPLVSAGVAFYAFLALVPTLIIVVAVYGLVADVKDVPRQVHNFAGALPHEVETFIQSQVTRIAKADTTGLSITLFAAILIALWSASGGMAALVTGISVARDQVKELTFVKKRIKGLLLTLGAVVVLSALLFLITAVPALLRDLGVDHDGQVVVNILRWPALAAVMVVGLGVQYRVAVEQPPRVRFGIVTPGTVVATLVWLVASAGFAFYTANFSRYSRTYGSLASIVVVLLWLYLSAFAVLLGAEVDGAIEEVAGARLSSDPIRRA
jgi:membrane protein